MSSTHALLIRSFASRRQRAIRAFSRARCSASTSRPIRSSKDSLFTSGFFCCSAQAEAKAVSRSWSSFCIVGSFSTSSSRCRASSFVGAGARGTRAQAPPSVRCEAGNASGRKAKRSVVVVAAADVLVHAETERYLRRARCGQRLSIETSLEDGGDALIAARASAESACTRRLQPVWILLSQPQDSEARAVAHLWVRSLREDGLDELLRFRADGCRPVGDARRGPLQMLLVRLGHVLRLRGVPTSRLTPRVRGESLPVS